MWRIGLPWVDSTHNDDIILSRGFIIGDGNERQIKSAKTFAETWYLDVCMIFYIVKIWLQLRIWIGNWVGKENFHILLHKVELKLKLILYIIGAVTTQPLYKLYIKTLVLPPYIVDLIGSISILSQGVGFHSFVIEVFVFGDIADIELNSSYVFFIIHLEIVPICMSSGICIASYETVILGLFYSNCEVQVATLEIGVESYLILGPILPGNTMDVVGLGILLANCRDGIWNGVDLDIIFLAVFPEIGVIFVQLDGINMPGSSVDHFESGIQV